MTTEKHKTPSSTAGSDNKQSGKTELPEDRHDPKHGKHDARSAKEQPAIQRETGRENQSEKGSGEGMTGMQRGAGHPTGR